jgi:hypothetical protein
MSKKSSKLLTDELKPYVAPFRYDGAGEFHLKSHKTNEKGGLDKEKATKIIEANRERLNDFQEKLYAQDRWSLLLIFQAWTPPARTVRSRACSRASTRRAAKSPRSSSRRRRNSTTISSGAA